MAHHPLPGFEALEKFVSKSSFGARPLIILFCVLLVMFFIFAPHEMLAALSFTFLISPLWAVPLLYRFALDRYIQDRRALNLAKQKYVLLELRIPRDTKKTPLAMETFFSSIHLGPGESNWYKKIFGGGTRPWFSFELVSLGGRVHFYVWTREGFRRVIETYLYAQYPEIEIIEAEDYSRLVDPSESEEYSMFGLEYTKNQKKSDAYPIRTYFEYGLTPGAKPEEQIDPLAQLLELMGSLGPQEQLWVQIMIRTNKNEKFAGKKNAKGEPYTISDDANEAIKGLREKGILAAGETKLPQPTEGQKEMIKAIERNMTKQLFEVGIRGIYFAAKDAGHGGTISAVTGLFKPFNNEAFNTLNPAPPWSVKYNDYPWEDPGGKRKKKDMEELVQLYRRRAFFVDPYVGGSFIMSTEELATLYHIPSSTVSTPSLPRLQSATAVAPANLPQ